MSAVVQFSSAEGIGRITFNRPPANAYDLEFHRQFRAAIRQADEDSSTRVVIVCSAIDKFFCAGADIKAFAANSTDDNKSMVNAARDALAAIEASGKIFIALLEGHALGGGLEIAMACDIRFATDREFKFGLPETRLGLLPGNGGSQRLPRIVGESHALTLLASGEAITPREAARIGLINRLLPREGAVEAADRFARCVAAAAPLAVAAAKRAVREGSPLPLASALALEAELVDELYDTDDAREGFNAAVEKRSPDYRGS